MSRDTRYFKFSFIKFPRLFHFKALKYDHGKQYQNSYFIGNTDRLPDIYREDNRWTKWSLFSNGYCPPRRWWILFFLR